MKRKASARRALCAVFTALLLAATIAPHSTAAAPPPSGPAPLAVTPLFVNYSAVSGLSGNLSINNQTRADSELFRGFLNGGRGACLIDYDGDRDDEPYLVWSGRE